MKKLLLDSGGLLIALQPLGCEEDIDEDQPVECGRLLSDWINSSHLHQTSRLHSLYFSLLTACLSTLTGNIKTELDKKHLSPFRTQPLNKTSRCSPPPSKRPRLTDGCPYRASNFDLFLLLDDGTRVPANRESLAGVEEVDGPGSEYFRALLRGGFVEAQGKAGKAIQLKDVSTGTLLPVLHYLHGCRFPVDTETKERDEGQIRGQCQVLESIVFKGLGGTEELLTEEQAFQKTPLGEMMIGACRFLVTELQRELEDLCVSLLLSFYAKAASQAASARTEDNTVRSAKMDESTEENLANRTSELELSGCEMQTEHCQAPEKKQSSKQASVTGAGKRVCKGLRRTITSVSKSSCVSVADKSLHPEESRSRPKNSMKSSARLQDSAARDSRPSSAAGGAGEALAALLLQVYWFSQRYSYPALGQACLSVLLGCETDCPQPLLSSVSAGDCLRRMAREVDCADALRRDLLSLATVALS